VTARTIFEHARPSKEELEDRRMEAATREASREVYYSEDPDRWLTAPQTIFEPTSDNDARRKMI